jgi:hypothetical protein
VLSSISLMAQSLSAAWRKDPADGERRAERLRELAQMAFEEMRALLRELTPGDETSTLAPSGAPLQALAGVLLEHHGLATAVTRLLNVMVPGISHCTDFDGVPQAAHGASVARVSGSWSRT